MPRAGFVRIGEHALGFESSEHELDRLPLLAQRAREPNRCRAFVLSEREDDGVELARRPRELAARREQLELTTDLRTALHDGDLDVAFQPIVELATGNVVRAEALARWRHPRLGSIAPDRFVDLAERMERSYRTSELWWREADDHAGGSGTWDAAADATDAAQQDAGDAPPAEETAP